MTDTHARITVIWLIATASWVILPYIFHLPVWALLPFLFMAGWRYMIHAHGWRSPGRIVRLVLLLLATLIIYQYYHTFLGRNAGLTFLLLLMGLKFSELNAERDRILLVFILFLLILGNFLYSQSLWVAGYLVVAVIACLATLVQIQQPTGLTVKKQLFVAGKLILAALPFMLVMYFLFPRISGGLWGLTNQNTATSGFSEELRPGSFSRLVESRVPVFRVQFERDQPPPAALQYWRGAVLSDTDGRRWFQNKAVNSVNAQVINGKQRVTYDVTLEPNKQGWLFPLDLPANKPNRHILSQGLTLKARHAISERQRYRLQSYLSYDTTIPKQLDRYLALPEQTSQRVRDLANTWRKQAIGTGGNINAAIVKQAMGYFREQLFYYTLEPPLLGGDPVDEFLFETKKGYCEHYAAAFVTLMRAAGVPARVVVGFQGGEYNPAGKYLTVRQSDAHAWAEYLDQKKGWVRADPTAAVAPSRIEYGIDSLRVMSEKGLGLDLLPGAALRQSLAPGWLRDLGTGLRMRWDAVNFAWYRWVEDFNPQRQGQILKKLGLLDTSWMLRVAVLTAIVIFMLAIFAAFILRKEVTLDKTQKLYLSFCRKLANVGFNRQLSEGPLSFASRVKKTKPEWAAAINKITDYYILLRYENLGKNITLKNLRLAIQQFKPL